jgi:hypothetical protein
MSDAVEQTPRFKVGDELAFMPRSPYGDRWYFERIDRITPTGILVCGKTRVRVSGGGLRVVGESGWVRTSVEPATDEIRREARRDRMLDEITKTDWRRLNDDVVERVYRIVHAWKPVEDK